ncbi:unnamed protein product [Merluccius merluccius]
MVAYPTYPGCALPLRTAVVSGPQYASCDVMATWFTKCASARNEARRTPPPPLALPPPLLWGTGLSNDLKPIITAINSGEADERCQRRVSEL